MTLYDLHKREAIIFYLINIFHQFSGLPLLLPGQPGNSKVKLAGNRCPRPLPPPTRVVVKLGLVRGPSEVARQVPWPTVSVK